MQILWLFLLVLLGDPTSEAAELNNNVLTRIISQFQTASGREPTATGGGQFAFLLALTADQCTNASQHIPFTPNNNGAPQITGSANNFLNIQDANYMAVYPERGSQCSESKLLHGPWPNTISPAESFSNLLNNRGMQVGCVILYTTYTPCTFRCFSNNVNCEIIKPLNMAPFKPTWANANIHKYFVFSKPYRPDMDRLIAVGNKLGQVQQAGFRLHRCDRPEIQNQNQMRCMYCNSPAQCLPEYIRT